ncbi:DUF1080 domain-containing protein [Candidatus Sumerlaeota bacterium]|nr:DUF1080 domain-containing protein [Candidatus Sumerlaeota bacterium]
MKNINTRLLLAVFLLGLMTPLQAADKDNSPAPVVVAPGAESRLPPSDAIVLFDGKDFSHWVHPDGSPVKWDLADGAMIVKPKTNSIMTKEKFGDAQIHVEFATPSMPDKQGQDRGNSGVYMQGRYEVQVLDSFQSDTYHDGQCGAIYSEHPPLVNACRPPEQWQSYDIIFRAPKFSAEGIKTAPGNLTVFHNGVLIQDHATVGGSTTASLYKEQPGDGPLVLQDHWCPVKYRNIWIRPLGEK